MKKHKDIEVLWNSNHTQYAILYTDGMYSGWSIMNVPEVAYDKRVVKYVQDHILIPGWQESFDYFKKAKGETMMQFHDRPQLKEFDEFLSSIGYKDCYLPPIARIKIVWIDAGRKWHIRDGGECQEILEFEDELFWNSFIWKKKKKE